MFYEEISGEILKKNAPAPEVRLLIRIQFNMAFCFGTNQKKFQALEFLPRLKSFLSRREKRTPDRRLLLNKNGLTFCFAFNDVEFSEVCSSSTSYKEA